ncbi:MAG: DUF3703 domain-containing protein [Hyphomonadaceae bacterium]
MRIRLHLRAVNDSPGPFHGRLGAIVAPRKFKRVIMEYLVGLALGLAACGLGTIAGFERDRAFYPVMMIVIASYYVLFAVVGGDGRALNTEFAIAIVFACLAVIAFRTSLWIVAAALLGHAGFDLVHGHVVTNPGTPTWWPMFCASIDAFAGFYLAWRLASRRVDERNRLTFGNRIRAYVEIELNAAQAAERAGDARGAFRHLERAHVLGQNSTVQHVRVHLRMLAWGLRHHNSREIMGQVTRLIGAATKTWIGLVPQGNTGGARVSAFKTMPIPDDLADLIDVARSPEQWRN